MIDRTHILPYYKKMKTFQKWNMGTGCLVKNTKEGWQSNSIRDIIDGVSILGLVISY